jgi:hypothetical protein
MRLKRGGMDGRCRIPILQHEVSFFKTLLHIAPLNNLDAGEL